MIVKPAQHSLNDLIKKAKEKGKINPIPKNTIIINETRTKLSNS
jgi:hypothetical protein